MLCTLRTKKSIEKNQYLSVHSVYRHTVNLTDGDNLIALHPDFIEATPLSVALPMNETQFDEFAFCAQNIPEIVWNCGYLQTKHGLRWKTGEIQVWDARLHMKIGKAEQMLLAKELREFLLPMGDGGMSNAAVNPVGKDDSFVTAFLRKQVQEILNAPASERISSILPLIGMGMGLTPSGDDFIVGFLLAYQIAGIDLVNTELQELKEAIRGQAEKTNDVSRQYLLCACEGEFGVKLHRLIKESYDQVQIYKNLMHIKNTGHSSGIDTLNGISAGLTILLNKKKE